MSFIFHLFFQVAIFDWTIEPISYLNWEFNGCVDVGNETVSFRWILHIRRSVERADKRSWHLSTRQRWLC